MLTVRMIALLTVAYTSMIGVVRVVEGVFPYKFLNTDSLTKSLAILGMLGGALVVTTLGGFYLGKVTRVKVLAWIAPALV